MALPSPILQCRVQHCELIFACYFSSQFSLHLHCHCLSASSVSSAPTGFFQIPHIVAKLALELKAQNEECESDIAPRANPSALFEN